MKKFLPIVLTLLLATALRLFTLFGVGDFIWDEMFSFVYSQKPWLASFQFLLLETNPPLHLLTLKLWWYIFPENEFFSRLPSFLFGVGTVFAVYIAGKNFFNKT